VVPEPGSDEAAELYDSAKRVRSSRLLVPEAFAALARAQRAGRLGPRAATFALSSTRALLDEIEPVELDASLAERAGELATEHGLRGYDAVHLASYERIETSMSVLVTADGDLVRAAKANRHAVAVLGA
jgi:hypothetical protein